VCQPRVSVVQNEKDDQAPNRFVEKGRMVA
jgi:hypothetical protein